MKKFILKIFLQHGKWLWLVVYLGLAILAWKNRESVFRLIPVITDSALIHFVYGISLNILVATILSLGLVCLVQQIRTPSFTKLRFQKAVERIGLKNSLNQYPSLISVSKDNSKEHSLIYKLFNNGITTSVFNEHIEQLETALNVKIEHIELCKNSTHTKIFVTPRKYVKPTLISGDNSVFAKEFCKLPNLLCVGKTGSGKSYALTVLLGIYAKYIPNVSITICDYKKSSFASFADTPNFYGYEEVSNGIRKFYAEFAERLASNDENRNKQIKILLIDEYGALITAQDKKTADELKTMVANMLFMGRSLGIKVVIGVQRADAEHFKAGARDQFHSILGLGNLSREQKSMLFYDFKDNMSDNNLVGFGYLWSDGQSIERTKVAEITNFAMLDSNIREAMQH